MEETQKNNQSQNGIVFALTSQRIQLAITIGSVVVILANLYFFTKLAPLNQSIAINAINIEKNEKDISKLEDKLIRIEGKVDLLLQK